MTLGIIALCAGIAGYFYEGVLQDKRETEARVRMKRVRDAYMLYQVRKKGLEPANVSALRNLVAHPDDIKDPWGNLFILDTDSRTIISYGANGKQDQSGDSMNDDLIERLPPPVVEEQSAQPTRSGDVLPPIIARVYPIGPTVQLRPMVGATYTDAGSGINEAAVLLTIDDTDVTKDAIVQAKSIQWTPTSDLTEGPHKVILRLVDYSNNVATKAWNFSIVK